MANWGDYLSLTLTISLLAAAVYGVLYIREQIQKGIRVSKDKLHNKGIDVSATGAKVKTSSKLADRENYFDATQRGIVKALSKSSVGHGQADSPKLSRHTSTSSIRSIKHSLSTHSSPKLP